ncbi:MAG: nucleotidyltransferase family protein [Clostridia bacterium]|nr:nucleotidyltransferase family protein [Clostridia bacterium]
MNSDEMKVFFALLRSAIEGNKLNSEELSDYSDNLLADMIKLSVKHDISQILALGLKQNDLLSSENKQIENYIIKAVFRYERIRCDYENLCNVLERANISFLPLKGSVIRKYYPEPWMRTSCDIDILVREEDSEKAKSILVDDNGYSFKGKGSHDLSFFTPSNIHVELHYDLVEDGRVNQCTKILKNIWDNVVIRNDCEHWCEMTDEMFYFYHIAHMAKHFEDGGCGIRPLIDLWILDKIDGVDVNKRNELLEKGGLLKFADCARKLSKVWFRNEEHDLVTKQMEDYILRGGVYGNSENRIMVHQQKKGGRFKYALSKIFIPYNVIKFHYPILQKHRWLTPFMQVRRWCKIIFCGHLKRTTKELQYNSNITNEDAVKMQKFLNDIGL